MGLITNAKTPPKPIQPTQLNFPVFEQDFFVILRLALENTPWEPDDLPLVKKVANDLKILLEFTNKVRELRQNKPEPTQPEPVKIPKVPVDSATPETQPEPTPPVEKKN